MRNGFWFCLSTLLALALPSPAEAQRMPTGFLNRTVTVDGRDYPYVVYVPRAYTPERRWPVILFLHGAGERGGDGLKQTEVGLGRALRLHPERYPAIVVLPQCAAGQWWRDRMLTVALRALDQTMDEYRCDPDRQYLTGLSMGGYGSWLLAQAHPERFAAVVPICGVKPETPRPEVLARLPIWVFHGDADPAVPVTASREMVAAIKAAGNTTIRYTELPGVGHNAWDAAYLNPELPTWLFAQRRKQ